HRINRENLTTPHPQIPHQTLLQELRESYPTEFSRQKPPRQRQLFASLDCPRMGYILNRQIRLRQAMYYDASVRSERQFLSAILGSFSIRDESLFNSPALFDRRDGLHLPRVLRAH